MFGQVWCRLTLQKVSFLDVPGWLQGSYLFKLLAVDVPTASSAEQRLYVEGDSKLYHRGGVINELRDPFLQARQPRQPGLLHCR